MAMGSFLTARSLRSRPHSQGASSRGKASGPGDVRARRDLVLLAGVEEHRPLEEVGEGGPHGQLLVRVHEGADARLVVVLEEAQLDVVHGVHGLLPVEAVDVLLQGALALEVVLVEVVHVVVVGDVKGLIHLRVGMDAPAAVAHVDEEGVVVRLRPAR